MPPMTKARRPKSADSHTANTKPLRSSPLAGPALNRSPATPVLTVSSNEPVDDPLLTVPTPPICHVLHPKSSQKLDSCDSGSSTPTTSRRRLAPITAASNRSQSLYIPSTSSSDGGHASPSLRTRASEWEIDPLQSLSISRTPVRPRPSSGIASFRLPIPIVEEEPDCQVEEIVTDSSSKDTSRNSSTSEFTNSRSSSQPQVNSWYTANTYDVTPRFSRLGLSSSTVVMPLSPKEHRRVSRRNTNLTKTNTTIAASSSTTSLPTKRFYIPSLSSKSSTLTRVPLQPPQPLPSQTPPKRQPLSRTFSTTSSSETSSIASNSQCETPTPISTSTSSPSLTRSRSSEDSISTWYESLPPATPHLEHTALPAENDGEEYERDKGVVDGGMGVVDEFRRHHDRDGDHSQFHYSDITITIKNASDDGTRPDQVLTTERPDLHPQPTSQQPAPQPTTNPPFQTPTFPKDVKKERSSLRKKLVRIKLQPVHDVDDLEDVSSSFSTLNIKTMTTIRLTTPITTRAAEAGGKVAVELPEVPVPLVLPATLSVPVVVVNNSEDTLLSTSSISLPISPSKKKRSTFRSVFKNFIARW